MAAWPSLGEVRAFLRLQQDDAEDLVIDSARLAAIAYGIGRLGNKWAADATDLPDDAHEAALIDSARIYRRRDSIDGTLGLDVVVRVPRWDPEVERLYNSAGAPVVFG